MTQAADELRDALANVTNFNVWLAQRGYVPARSAPPMWEKKALVGARHFEATSETNAPFLLVLWDDQWTERSLLGSDVRARQQHANEYRTWLRSHGHERDAPSLCLVACPQFLVAFELNGDPFARRLRYTPARLERPGSMLEQRFARFGATAFAGCIRERESANALDDILDSGELTWDFSKLFGGSRLDDEFVQFMNHERRQIARRLLFAQNKDTLLAPMWAKLRQGIEGAALEVPSTEEIAADRRLRSMMLATVDTVLLRMVLYRYLEAQFGTRMSDEERTSIALGTYDDVLEKTAQINRGKLEDTRKGTRKATGKKHADQLGLFAQVNDPETLKQQIRQRADHFQREAGGDLHQGAVAEAANVLQQFLETYDNGATLAELIAATSTGDYSFHYADLDPRAFQELYQQTIGTDLHVKYDATTNVAEVDVVERQRNRKEQGAYYTDEELSRWLVDRTLGRLWDEWEHRFEAFLDEHARRPEGRLPAVRAFLDEMLNFRIIDPTCGGGIFLRAAFELLSHKRERVLGRLGKLPEAVRRELTREPRYHMFDEQAELGEWEWHILLNMLYGVDVDVKAVNVASNLLTLSALTYKRHGVSFPSFINTSLKAGNALVSPLRPADRAAFGKRHESDLIRLIELREQLRNPTVERAAWTTLHAEAAALTRAIVRAEIVEAFREAFQELGNDALIQRVQRVGLFLYEVEFPEVYFDIVKTGKAKQAKLVLREKAGFDVVVGNPPWEEPAAEYKHFLPEFDATYRDLSGAASKKREEELLSNDHIRKRWDDFCASVEDYKTLLEASGYEHQRRRVKGKIPGAHTNLYKYATERSYQILREGGFAGLVVDGGLWSDLASSGLRALLLDQCETTEVCGFINYQDIFPDIDNRSKFSVTVFRRGGVTAELRAIFMRERWDELSRFDQLAVRMQVAEIRSTRRDSYPVPEVRSIAHSDVERALGQHAALYDEPWSVDILAEEVNAGRQRGFFRAKNPGDFPLIQGQQFNIFGVNEGELPDAWVDPSDDGAGGFVRARQENRILEAITEYVQVKGGTIRGNKRDAALAWIAARTGIRELPREWIRLDWEGYRIAWRDITNATNQRTLIAGIVPQYVALSHKAPFIRPFRMHVADTGVTWSLQYEMETLLYLAGVLSSFACDSVARTRVAKTNLSSQQFTSLPVPEWSEKPQQRRVATLTARLTCLPPTAERPWADYSELAAAVSLTPEKDGLIDPAQRREAEVELNALVAELYGLGARSFRFLMDTLFMTPKHKETHARMRDDIAERLKDE